MDQNVNIKIIYHNIKNGYKHKNMKIQELEKKSFSLCLVEKYTYVQ